ncbi:MMPL family transporter [Amycolatopsis sp. Hca4]|uniref:MMPL family transporter n=1 Tax=Amycolatopsis sp. Hca4 TaxID=2742131 RepID=UPI0015909A65|nr:MMPL family transporter [Amycolatopsis sp. Hca4]QKV80071.1 MMPL family transporter [Amycolatopsis sp. Hca4]
MKPSLAVRASCWSAGHAGVVIGLWLVFVALAQLPGLSGGHRLGEGSLSDPDVAANWWPVVAAPVAVLLTVPFSRLLLLVSGLFTSVVTTASAALLDTVSESVTMAPRTGNAALLVVITVAVQHMLFTFCRRREALASGNDSARAARIVASTAGNAALVSGSGVAAALTAVALAGAADVLPLATAVLVAVLTATVAALSLLPALNDRVLTTPRELPPQPAARLKVSDLPRFVRPTAIAVGVGSLGAAAVYGAVRVFSPGCAACRPLAADLDAGGVTTMLVVLALATLVAYRRPVVALATFLLNGFAVLAGLGMLAVFVDPLPGWAPMVLVVVLLVPANHLQVYLLHRLRSETLAGMSRRNTVAHACRRAWSASGGALLVTVVMWLVWGMTESGDVREFALATAVILVADTLVVRFLLLPRLAVLGGRTNWWRVRGPKNTR